MYGHISYIIILYVYVCLYIFTYLYIFMHDKFFTGFEQIIIKWLIYSTERNYCNGLLMSFNMLSVLKSVLHTKGKEISRR